VNPDPIGFADRLWHSLLKHVSETGSQASFSFFPTAAAANRSKEVSSGGSRWVGKEACAEIQTAGHIGLFDTLEWKRQANEWSCLNRSNRWLPRSCSHQGVSIGQEYGIKKRSDGGVPSFKSDRISLQIPSCGLKRLQPGRFFVILGGSGLALSALREESCVASSRILSRVRTDCRCDKIACCD
jgi:hypothetical protein